MNLILKEAPVKTAKDEILALAKKYNVAYTPTPLDGLADHVTKLSGDDVELDEPGRLLLALQRAGHVTKSEATRLHFAHLRAKYE